MTSELQVRSTSFGQGYSPTLVDRFGVWLSARQIHRWVPSFEGLRIADLGCGYHAKFTRSVLDQVKSATIVDVDLDKGLESHEKTIPIKGDLMSAVVKIPSQSMDVVMCISVLEHLWDPLLAVTEFKRILAPRGICLLNVPSWRGKAFLEFAAFRLHFSPEEEMNDHKMYYDVKDLWPVLVRGGFKPSMIQCFKHKFGLNTFAFCKVEK